MTTSGSAQTREVLCSPFTREAAARPRAGRASTSYRPTASSRPPRSLTAIAGHPKTSCRRPTTEGLQVFAGLFVPCKRARPQSQWGARVSGGGRSGGFRGKSHPPGTRNAQSTGPAVRPAREREVRGMRRGSSGQARLPETAARNARWDHPWYGGSETVKTAPRLRPEYERSP